MWTRDKLVFRNGRYIAYAHTQYGVATRVESADADQVIEVANRIEGVFPGEAKPAKPPTCDSHFDYRDGEMCDRCGIRVIRDHIGREVNNPNVTRRERGQAPKLIAFPAF